MSNPYKGLENFQFWRRSISTTDYHTFDPIVQPKFRLRKDEKIATAGSCFAQHIARRLSAIGFNYYVPESGEGLSDQERKERGFGMFSARYGNIYTVRQLVQLFDEAFETRASSELPWLREDGRYIDPFRPNIEPQGFKDAKGVLEERSKHLKHVKDMFLNADVFVYTLGLTEGWMSKTSGDVFPLAPGVSGGSFNETDYAYKNFSVIEVMADLNAFLQRLKSVNAKIKVLLTVSPVPLIATFEKQHVLVSTTYSKSVLRVAAETASREYDWVEYFPSYEIITGNFNLGKYYEDDLREVNSNGVSHVMRCFLRHYAEGHTQKSVRYDVVQPINKHPVSDIICDEESIAKTAF
ncbi:GSCFA domain-containing protein [Aquirhabdus sp.]|uniref:GSCFA domain-containing protein n=1 Tax=Aquirhabdus sp. TaxID=2824160 RepID=UPI00396C96FE